MTPERLVHVIERVCDVRLKTQQGLEFVHDDVPMACLFDAQHDRIRVLSPIIGLEAIDETQRETLLEANFHTTLDARYASARGTMYALYVHRLSTLSEQDLVSGIEQVSALVRNFGGDYSSGSLIYGPDEDSLH